MIPDALHDAIAEEGKAVADLASQWGAKIDIDPEELLRRDIALQPPSRWSANGHCRLIETNDGWIAVNLARDDDRGAVAAWLEHECGGEPWDVIVDLVRNRASAGLLERALLLGLPVGLVGETAPTYQPVIDVSGNQVPRCSSLSSLTVVDLSALWAGPLCGGLLAEAGMDVVKVEDPARPDPTRRATPRLDRKLNGRKRRISMKLRDPKLWELVSNVDILITSARPHALARLGLTRETLVARNPGLIWVAITAHGVSGPSALRVGFGDDCAASGGLVGWDGLTPLFLGDALADPLTGLRAAHLVLRYLAEGHTGLVDVALATVAADFAHRSGLR